MPETTLCISCNAPAEEFDHYADLANELLSTMAAGITLVRLSQEQPKVTPRGLTEWKVRANSVLHLGNDFNDAQNQYPSRHAECDAWKIALRRVRSLLRDLHFELTLIRGLK